MFDVYMYRYMYRLYVCPLNARVGSFFSLQTPPPEFLAVSSDTTAVRKGLGTKLYESSLEMLFFFKSSQKVVASGYYGIETLYQTYNILYHNYYYYDCSTNGTMTDYCFND